MQQNHGIERDSRTVYYYNKSYKLSKRDNKDIIRETKALKKLENKLNFKKCNK
jgi:predicted solute-binding protein